MVGSDVFPTEIVPFLGDEFVSFRGWSCQHIDVGELALHDFQGYQKHAALEKASFPQ